MANVCAKCGMEFDSEEELREHEQSAHGAAAEGGGKAICPSCGMEFDSQEDLGAHVKSAHGA